jgi:hypothetical protein
MPVLARRRQLADFIADEDANAIAAYNARAAEDRRLRTAYGASPYDGDIEHAPVVLLVAHPAHDESLTPAEQAFQHRGWPLAGLHSAAPAGLREIWETRLASLIEAFGAHHVANSVAALPLTPWVSPHFDEALRLPSRTRMLDLAGAAVRRGAMIVVTCSEERWTESEDVAGLGPERCFHAKSRRATHVSIDNLGAAPWHAVCRRIEAHRRSLLPF